MESEKMNVNTTNTSNSTWVDEDVVSYTKVTLGFGPAWVYIGATAAIIFVIICFMWVVARNVNNRGKDERRNYHYFPANFPAPLISYKASDQSNV